MAVCAAEILVPGLLIDGRLVDVPGVQVISPGDEPWAVLDARDHRRRRTTWVQQITIHTTKGIWPQHVIPGAGPGGRDRAVADFWRGDRQHSAAHIVVDNDGSIVCLADLARDEAFHATKVNVCSAGIEMYQEAGGGIYEAVLESTVKLVLTLCDQLGIPLQIHTGPYVRGEIIERLLHGGQGDVVGVFGHRANSWMFPQWIEDPAVRARYPSGYASRGQGDPGDEIFARLAKAGAMRFDFTAEDDRAWWRPVQQALVDGGESIGKVDGVCGPRTVGALRRLGLWSGGRFLERPIV